MWMRGGEGNDREQRPPLPAIQLQLDLGPTTRREPVGPKHAPAHRAQAEGVGGVLVGRARKP